MKVSEFIKWLETQDQDATVEVVERIEGSGYEGDSFRLVKFNPNEHSCYIDFRGNKFVDEDAYYKNKRILEIGSGI